ncbi:hypothetical protein M8A51_25635 [Schlegelella sp. S2-27]|uniref:Uncharacterized protein n=1 Tax=Caldimonas mangrovi TaxID=2944811 RepID=A0ABT0YWV7_9BURK|nr:hypothetical protein [Caldimonas mangrovi]MCM5682919.1 hypothetical protein [Caldimonas mangrovi]
MRDFAKIERAANGQQVLFWVDKDAEEDLMVLRMAANFEGYIATMTLCFNSLDDEEAAFAALGMMGAEQADNFVAKVVGGLMGAETQEDA